MNKDKKFTFNIYTDLAVEAREMADQEETGIEGVTYETSEQEDITLSWVKIENAKGAELMGKPIGNYITLESSAIKENNTDKHEKIITVLAEKIVELGKLSKDACILVVGLGNWNVTPDALGPKVVSQILVTRHIFEAVPEELGNDIRQVCAITPGVMGITGIESQEIVKGIVERIQPDLVIAIDALAARHTKRINAAIQMSDTGVSPGAGMGNKRKPLNEESLGVPVIAIGVPTVVDAATLVNDTMDRMLFQMAEAAGEGSPFYEMLQDLDSEEKYGLIVDILTPYEGNMFVTPKEVDDVMDKLSHMIADAINIALHPGIDREDLHRYTR